MYHIINEVNPSVKTIGSGVYSLCKNKNRCNELCDKKIQSSALKVARLIRDRIGVKGLQSKIAEYRKHKNRMIESHHRFISGKDFLMPLLFERVKSEFKIKASKPMMLNLLVSHFERKHDNRLCSRIQYAVNK